MLSTTAKCLRVLLYGLDESLAAELGSALASACGSLSLAVTADLSTLASAVQGSGTDAIFCASDPQCRGEVTSALGSVQGELPLYVVSRNPDYNDWLDALEHGATDYCAAPFEPQQLRWLLASKLP